MVAVRPTAPCVCACVWVGVDLCCARFFGFGPCTQSTMMGHSAQRLNKDEKQRVCKFYLQSLHAFGVRFTGSEYLTMKQKLKLIHLTEVRLRWGCRGQDCESAGYRGGVARVGHGRQARVSESNVTGNH